MAEHAAFASIWKPRHLGPRPPLPNVANGLLAHVIKPAQHPGDLAPDLWTVPLAARFVDRTRRGCCQLDPHGSAPTISDRALTRQHNITFLAPGNRRRHYLKPAIL